MAHRRREPDREAQIFLAAWHVINTASTFAAGSGVKSLVDALSTALADGDAEEVREVLLARASTRHFLEREYPAAAAPLPFRGGRVLYYG